MKSQSVYFVQSCEVYLSTARRPAMKDKDEIISSERNNFCHTLQEKWNKAEGDETALSVKVADTTDVVS